MDNIGDSLEFLRKKQQTDGSFAGSESTFLTSLILSCLNSLNEDPVTETIKKKSADFLLSQKSRHWSFNYWKRESKKNLELPYPDDLDDTFCALAALSEYDRSLLRGDALAKITTILTATEESEGGPYRTWIVPPNTKEVWRDVDIAVNSNVAYFLARQGVFLPKLRRYFRGMIRENNLISKYYPNIFPVVYFLARYFTLDTKIGAKSKHSLVRIILSHQKDGSYGNPLNTALAVAALLNLGAEPGMVYKNIQYLRETEDGGSWPEYEFCRDPVIDGKQYFAGSKALTTSFCVQAEYLYKQKIGGAVHKDFQEDVVAKQIYEKIIKNIRERFEILGAELQQEAYKMLEQILTSDIDKQIGLLPYLFSSTLKDKSERMSEEFLVELGMANFYGWIAYRVYDDFFDDEEKKEQLSVANTCLRELTNIYGRIIPKTFKEVMDTMDSANSWEIHHTRGNTIPDYGDLSQLANKSLGHALGPLAILSKSGYGPESDEFKNFMEFFQHYIIARQLNDDAHDWEDDLKRGQINAVGAMVLSKTPTHSKMKEVFWKSIYMDVSKTILKHTGLAKKAWPSLSTLLAPIENSTSNGLREYEDSESFLNTYTGELSGMPRGSSTKKVVPKFSVDSK